MEIKQNNMCFSEIICVLLFLHKKLADKNLSQFHMLFHVQNKIIQLQKSEIKCLHWYNFYYFYYKISAIIAKLIRSRVTGI